jgi:hypothetical protein
MKQFHWPITCPNSANMATFFGIILKISFREFWPRSLPIQSWTNWTYSNRQGSTSCLCQRIIIWSRILISIYKELKKSIDSPDNEVTSELSPRPISPISLIRSHCAWNWSGSCPPIVNRMATEIAPI